MKRTITTKEVKKIIREQLESMLAETDEDSFVDIRGNEWTYKFIDRQHNHVKLYKDGLKTGYYAGWNEDLSTWHVMDMSTDQDIANADDLQEVLEVAAHYNLRMS